MYPVLQKKVSISQYWWSINQHNEAEVVVYSSINGKLHSTSGDKYLDLSEQVFSPYPGHVNVPVYLNLGFYMSVLIKKLL